MTYMFKSSERQKEIDRNVTKRQKLKSKWDRHCKYSAEDQEMLPASMEMFSHEVPVSFAEDDSNENWVRMLDEGVVVDGDGYCYAVIKKGVLKTFYENLPDNFEGYIDRDHVRALRLGKYSKKDMKLVEIGNERYGIDINVKLDHDYYATRDLLRQGEHRAVSVEMGIDIDEFGLASKITKDKSQGEYLVPLIGAVDIVGYAVCENPKNANSIKDDLLDKASVEGDNMSKEELEKLAAEEATKAEEEKASTTSVGEPEVEAEAEAETSKVAEEMSEESTSTESTEEKATAEDEVEAEADEASEVEKGLEQLEAAITELRAELAEKEKKIAELENQLAAKAEVKLSNSERIAKLLNFAKGVEPTPAEGSKVDMTSEKAEDKYAADDALWDEAAKSLNY